MMRNPIIRFTFNPKVKALFSRFSEILNKISGNINPIEFQNKIYTVASLVGISYCLISFYWNYSLLLNPLLNITTGVVLVVYVALYYLSRFKRKYYSFLLAITTLVMLSVAWLLSEGSKGPIPLLYLISIAFFVTFSKTRYSIIYLALTVSNIAILVLIEY